MSNGVGGCVSPASGNNVTLAAGCGVNAIWSNRFVALNGTYYRK